MSIHVHTNTGYKLILNAWQKHEGVWRKLPAIFYKAEGRWLEVFAGQAPFIYEKVLTGSVFNFNLRDAALSAGWDGSAPLTASVTLQNCTVAANAQGSYAFTTGFTFPDGSSMVLSLDASSRIIGRGGKGGKGGGPTAAGNGENGSPALFVNIPTVLRNLGVIAGGGGGGAGGGYTYGFDGSISPPAGIISGAGGDGGAGLGMRGESGVSSGYGFGYRASDGAQGVISEHTPSVAGSLTAGGVNPSSLYNNYPRGALYNRGYMAWRVPHWDVEQDDSITAEIVSGQSGIGGALGSAGGVGGGPLAVNTPPATRTAYPNGQAGLGGNAIAGYSLVTVIQQGTLYGGTIP